MSNKKESEDTDTQLRQMLPFFVEFVKFSAAFAVIIAAALLALNTVKAAL